MTDPTAVDDLPPRPDAGAVRWDTFVSYRHVDRPRAHALAQALAARDLVVFFDERGIHLGAAWESVLGAALAATRSCVVLVGPTGVDGVQGDEVRRALERQAVDPDFPIIPVVLPDGDEGGFFAAYLHERSHLGVGDTFTDDDIDRIANAIRGLGLEVPTGPPRPNPYPGLRPFDRTTAADFFGRDGEVADLLARGARSSLVGVVGPSGTGKSSVLLAGLLPALEADGHDVVTFRPGRHPRRAALRALGVADDPDTTLAGAVRARPARAGRRGRPVVAVDQLEEVVTRTQQAADRAWLLDGLCELAAGDHDQPLVIVTARSDHLGALNEHPAFGAALARATYLLGPLDDEGVRDAIRRPAWGQGVGLQDGLVDEMVDDLRGQPNALPLLAVTLAEMWDHRRGDRLTIEAYQAVGRVAGALSQRAEAVVTAAPPTIVETTLGRLVEVLPDGGAVRRRRRRDDLLAADGATAAAMTVVVDDLVAARLVVAGDDDGEPTYELAHDALLTSWGRLADLVRTRRQLLELRGRLGDATDAWMRAGRTDDAVLRGEALATFDGAVTRGDVLPTANEVALLAASRAVARRGRRRLAFVAVLAALALVAVAVAVGLDRRGRRTTRERDAARVELEGATADRALADRARRDAEADRNAARALGQEAALARDAAAAAADAAVVDRQAATALLNGSRVDGIRQALTAARLRSTEATRQALAHAATQTPQPALVRSVGVTDRVVPDPSGAADAFLVARADGSVERCVIAAAVACTVVLRVADPTAGITQLAATSDGRPAVLASDGSVALPGWRVVVPGATAMAPLSGAVGAVIGTADGRVEVHRADGAAVEVVRAGGGGRVRLLAVDPTDRLVAVADVGAPGLTVLAIGGPPAPGTPLGFGTVGQVLVSDRHVVASTDGREILAWPLDRLGDGAPPLRLGGHRGRITALQASGAVAVSGDDAGDVRRWRLDPPRLDGLELTDGAVSAAAGDRAAVAVRLDTTSGRVAVVHTDGTAAVWPTGDPPVAVRRDTADGWPIPDADGTWSSLAADGWRRPDGTVVATEPVGHVLAAARRGDVLVVAGTAGVTSSTAANGAVAASWRAAPASVTAAVLTDDGALVGLDDGRVVALDAALAATVVRGPGPSVTALAATPDGRVWAAARAGSGDVLLVDGTGDERALGGHRGPVLALAFSPDGGRLASGGDDRAVLVHDVRGPSGRGPQRLTGHGDKVTAVAFVPGSDVLVSAGEDASLRLWTGAGAQLGAAIPTEAQAVSVLLPHPTRAAVLVVDRGGARTLDVSGWSERLCAVVGPAPTGTPDPCG